LAASIFHKNEFTVLEIKEALINANINIRI